MESSELIHFVEICLRRGMLSDGCYFAEILFGKGDLEIRKCMDKFIDFADEDVSMADPYLLVFLLKMRKKFLKKKPIKKEWMTVVQALLTSKVSRISFSLTAVCLFDIKQNGKDGNSTSNSIDNFKELFIKNLEDDEPKIIEIVRLAIELYIEFKGSNIINNIFDILKSSFDKEEILYKNIISARQEALGINNNICHLTSAIILTLNRPLIYPVLKTPIYSKHNTLLPELFMLDWNTIQGIQLGRGISFYLKESLKMDKTNHKDTFFKKFKYIVKNIQLDSELSEYETPEEYLRRSLFTLSFSINDTNEESI